MITRAEVKTEHEAMVMAYDRVTGAFLKGFTTEDMQNARLLDGLPRKWKDPDAFLYAAHKGVWAHYNKISHTVV